MPRGRIPWPAAPPLEAALAIEGTKENDVFRRANVGIQPAARRLLMSGAGAWGCRRPIDLAVDQPTSGAAVAAARLEFDGNAREGR